VRNRGHVDEITARQRHVRSDARALGSQRLLGDLHQDFLAFLQHFGNLYGMMITAGALGLNDDPPDGADRDHRHLRDHRGVRGGGAVQSAGAGLGSRKV